MGHVFLSDSWFAEAERLRAEHDPPVPEILKDLVINMLVTNGPDGDVEARMHAGRFEKGLAAEAPTKLIVPYDIARKMFIENDQNASMQAFMSGQIKVEGDMTKLMSMQAAGPPSPEAEKVQAAVREMTD
jgi:hypothetical protein